MLLRRADTVEVIGEAVVAAARAEGHRPIAARLGRAAATVRGWLRRFAARAEMTASHAVGCIYRFDTTAFRVEPAHDASPTRAAFELLAQAVRAIKGFMDGPGRPRWQVISGLSGGRPLANTSCPYPPLW